MHRSHLPAWIRFPGERSRGRELERSPELRAHRRVQAQLLTRPDGLHDAAHLPVELERKALHRARGRIDLPVEEIRIEGGEAREQCVERRAGGSDRRGRARKIPRTERRCNAIEARCERLGFALERTGVELRRQRAQRLDGVAERPLRRARKERGEILQRLPNVLLESRLVHFAQRDRRRDEPQEIVEYGILRTFACSRGMAASVLCMNVTKPGASNGVRVARKSLRPLDGFEPVRARLRGLRRRWRRRYRAAAWRNVPVCVRPGARWIAARHGVHLGRALEEIGGGAKLAFMRR